MKSTSSSATSVTSPVSTLSPADGESAQAELIQRMRDDPAYAKSILQQVSSPSPGLSPPSDGPITASEHPPKEGEGARE